MQNVGAIDLIFAGQCVKRDLRGRGAIGEIIKRASFSGGTIPMNFGRFIKSGCRQMDAGHIGLFDKLGKAQQGLTNPHVIVQKLYLICLHLPVLCCKVDQPIFDFLGGIKSCHAVQVGAA